MLVWLEDYLRGELPQTDDLRRFNQVRARELHKFALRKPEVKILAELENMLRKLFELAPEDRLFLWLNCCPFDQAMLDRIFKLLKSRPLRPRITIRQAVACNREAFLHCQSADGRLFPLA